jgi:hypothetical protein
MKHFIPSNLLGMLLLLLGLLASAESAQDKELKIFLNDEKNSLYPRYWSRSSLGSVYGFQSRIYNGSLD